MFEQKRKTFCGLLSNKSSGKIIPALFLLPLSPSSGSTTSPSSPSSFFVRLRFFAGAFCLRPCNWSLSSGQLFFSLIPFSSKSNNEFASLTALSLCFQTQNSLSSPLITLLTSTRSLLPSSLALLSVVYGSFAGSDEVLYSILTKGDDSRSQS